MKAPATTISLLVLLASAALLLACNREAESNPLGTAAESAADQAFASAPEADDGADLDESMGVCSAHEVVCGESVQEAGCVDLATSTQHCGACGRRCFSDQECTEGACTGVGVITSDELARALEEKDFLLINVRVPAHDLIPGTDASVPHDRLDLMKEVLGEDRDRRAVLYCGTSTRIRIALRLLREEGYTNISVLDNGITGWTRAGFSTVARSEGG